MTAQGFRSAASSMLNECGMWNVDAIERQLANFDNDSVRRAYARADYWDERVRIMGWWAGRWREMHSTSARSDLGFAVKKGPTPLGCSDDLII